MSDAAIHHKSSAACLSASPFAAALFTASARPNQVLFYEVWESADAQQTYMAWRVERGDLTILMSFLSAEPAFTALKRIAI
jgi:hypothetical protein